jgi:hypothetical protein
MIDEKLLKEGTIIKITQRVDGGVIFHIGEEIEIVSAIPIITPDDNYSKGTIKYVCKLTSSGEIDHFWANCKMITDDYFEIIYVPELTYEIY